MPFQVKIRRSTSAGLAALLVAGATAATVALVGGPAGVASAATPAPSGTWPAVTTTNEPMDPTPTTATAVPTTPTTPTTPTGHCLTVSPRSTPTAWTAGTIEQAYRFENGTTTGFTASGGTALALDPAAAAGGTAGLSASGWTLTGGVAFTLDSLAHTGWYKISIKARVSGPGSTYLEVKPVPTGSGAVAVPGSVLISSTGWTTATAYFRPGSVSVPNTCSYISVLGGTTVHLSLAPSVCSSPYIDRPVTVQLDDVEETTADSASGGSPTPTTTPAAPQQAPNCSGGTTTPPPPAPTCQARYTVVSEWPGGYVASVDLRNLRSTALPTWTAGWTFPDDQRVTQLWGAGSWTQTGRAVTVTAPAWGPLPANGTANLGFLGTLPAGTAHAALPAAVSLNGEVCEAFPS